MTFTLSMKCSKREYKRAVALALREIADQVERGVFAVPQCWKDVAYQIIRNQRGQDVGRAGFTYSFPKRAVGNSH